jgi:S1-C subfamily serine protease
MDKLIISSEEVASVSGMPPVVVALSGLPKAVSRIQRVMLFPLVLVLPLLSLVTVIMRVGTRRKDPRVRHAWMQYCCTLLIISGISSSIAAGFVYFMLVKPQRNATLHFASPIPFSLDGPLKLSDAVSAEPLSPRELASRVEGAVFVVSRDSKSMKPTKATLALSGFGTGVLVFAGKNDYLLATSRHVIDGEDWQHSAPYAGDAMLWDRMGGFSHAQIVGRHKLLDLMLLRIPRAAGKSEFAQPVLDFANIAAGERIMVFGHPEGLFFSLSDGLVSRKDPTGQFQITAPVSPGASGGPVYDLHGQLLGIVSSMVDKRLSPDSENLNFAVPADALLHPDQWQGEPTGMTALKEFADARAISKASHPSPNHN